MAGGQVSSVQFEPVTFAELPGWRVDDHAAAFAAFARSSNRLVARGLTGAWVDAMPGVQAAIGGQPSPPASVTAARAFFETHFVPHRVVHGGGGLLTAYYEPVIDGSRTPSPQYRTPIYRRPPDLVTIVPDAMRGATGETYTHARSTPQGVVPYATRAEIEQGALAGRGLELAYVADAVEAFFLQIQGSGQIRLSDGTTFRVAYDGKNGHPYRSIGRRLIEQGQIGEAEMSLQSLAAWLRADLQRGRETMWHNQSFVFFRELTGAQAAHTIGVDEIALTPGRSLAVDAGVHAIGTPVYVSSPALEHMAPGGLHRLMIAQDVGSAIKGPERGDIFAGTGTAAGAIAGITKHPGRFFVLLPRGYTP